MIANRSRSRAVRRRHPALRARRGFSIVELIVAIMIISVGVIALAGSSAVVLREMQLAQRQTVAATIAQSRLETLRSYTACSNITSGSASGVYPETWTVSTVPSTMYNARYVVETVTYKYRSQTKTYTVKAMVPCT